MTANGKKDTHANCTLPTDMIPIFPSHYSKLYIKNSKNVSQCKKLFNTLYESTVKNCTTINKLYV